MINPIIAATNCQNNFLGLPSWYKYLKDADICEPQLQGLGDLWLIGLAVIELLLRVAIIVAIAYVLIGGFKFITSRASPEKTNSAKNTVIDGLIGLVIAIVATAVIVFVAGEFKQS